MLRMDFVFLIDECQLTSGDWEMQGQSKYGTKVPCLDDECCRLCHPFRGCAAWGKTNENAPEGANESANVRLRMNDENTPCGV